MMDIYRMYRQIEALHLYVSETISEKGRRTVEYNGDSATWPHGVTVQRVQGGFRVERAGQVEVVSGPLDAARLAMPTLAIVVWQPQWVAA